MDWTSVLLAGLGAGLVGSLIGLAGTWAIDWHRADVTMRGNARALYFETIRKAAFLHGMAAGDVPIVDVSDSVWRQTMVPVATLLNAFDLKVVTQAYAFIDLEQERIVLTKGLKGADALDQAAWDSAANEFDRAASVLRKRAWNDREQAELEIRVRG